MSGYTTTPVPTTALWTWANTGGNSANVVGYANGNLTKTGITPLDLQNYVGVPLVVAANGQSVPVPDSVILNWIRWAEDMIEQETNVRLCPTWIAAPAAKDLDLAQNSGIATQSGGPQVLGVDYDLEEAPYDFHYENAQDDGWMIQKLRWRPVKGPNYSDRSGVKNYAFIYPLVNSYFNISADWFVTDPDYGFIRLVPSRNLQMLPLYQLQLGFSGFANSIPGGIWINYVAGLSANDYNSEYGFMRQYVLAVAAVTALGVIQGSINYGVTESVTTVDGLSQKVAYSTKGPYAGLIQFQTEQIKILKAQVRTRMGGIPLIML